MSAHNGFGEPRVASSKGEAEYLDPALMRRYEVGSRGNLVKNDDAGCAEAVVEDERGVGV